MPLLYYNSKEEDGISFLVFWKHKVWLLKKGGLQQKLGPRASRLVYLLPSPAPVVQLKCFAIYIYNHRTQTLTSSRQVGPSYYYFQTNSLICFHYIIMLFSIAPVVVAFKSSFGWVTFKIDLSLALSRLKRLGHFIYGAKRSFAYQYYLVLRLNSSPCPPSWFLVNPLQIPHILKVYLI